MQNYLRMMENDHSAPLFVKAFKKWTLISVFGLAAYFFGYLLSLSENQPYKLEKIKSQSIAFLSSNSR